MSESETGFSRYKDTCLDFGDLVRQSRMSQQKDRQQTTDEDDKQEIESGALKKHQHSKCRKRKHHLHKSSTESKKLKIFEHIIEESPNTVKSDQPIIVRKETECQTETVGQANPVQNIENHVDLLPQLPIKELNPTTCKSFPQQST